MNIRVLQAMLRKSASIDKRAGFLDDIKHIGKGFQWRHLLPDKVAKHVLRDYAPGNIDPLTGPEMDHKNAVEFLSRNKDATAFGMRPQIAGSKGTQVSFYPTTTDPAKQLLRIYGVNNPTQAQMDAMNERIRTSKAARLANGVPENDADYKMNYDPALVSHYSDPVTGEVHEMPEREGSSYILPEIPTENPAARFQVGDRVRAYAAQAGAEPGLLDLSQSKSAMLHEGLYKYQGHYGAGSVYPLGTNYPYVKDPESPVAGLPYHSMSSRTVGGDPAMFNLRPEWFRELNRMLGNYKPATPNNVFDNIVRKSALPETSYSVSPPEFGTAASNIKNVAAITGEYGLFKFNPDNPGVFIDSLERLAPEYDGYTGLRYELDEVYRIFKRYEQLHKRHSLGEQLTPAELNEYNHYRKSLPGIWDQARNTKPYSQSGYQNTAIG